MNGRIILIALGGIILQKLVVIRHCEAEGQAPTANLTHSGQYQAKELVKFLEGMPIKKSFLVHLIARFNPYCLLRINRICRSK